MVAAKLLEFMEKFQDRCRLLHVIRDYNERTDRLAHNAVVRERSFMWRGDNWNEAHRNWVTEGRCQRTSVDNPLRLLPDGQVLPVLTAPPLLTRRAPLLTHDIDWVITQLNNAISAPPTDSQAEPPPPAPTLTTLRSLVVAHLGMATVDMPTHMAVGGRLYQWASSQCTTQTRRRQNQPPACSRIPVVWTVRMASSASG